MCELSACTVLSYLNSVVGFVKVCGRAGAGRSGGAEAGDGAGAGLGGEIEFEIFEHGVFCSLAGIDHTSSNNLGSLTILS